MDVIYELELALERLERAAEVAYISQKRVDESNLPDQEKHDLTNAVAYQRAWGKLAARRIERARDYLKERKEEHGGGGRGT